MKIATTMPSNVLSNAQGSATAVGIAHTWPLTSGHGSAPRYATALEQISARVPASADAMAAKREELTFAPRTFRTCSDPPV
ncbi:MAG: hypothetical protein ACT4PP_10985 [Sporichthyaceae bacterium]